jgi:hypothetical protein
MYDTPHGYSLFPNSHPPLKSQKHQSESAKLKSRKHAWIEDQAGSATEGADPWLNAQNGKSEHQQINELLGVTIKVFWNEIQFLFPKNSNRKAPKPPKRKKGDITQFSRKSRLRLLRLFNRLQLVCLGDPIFITLTARPECFEVRRNWLPEDYRDVPHNYIFRKEFLPMLKEFIPEPAYIWKMEPHKSGQAHYHLMVWSWKKSRKLGSQYYARKIRRLWRNCIDDHSRSAELYSCKIKKINSEKAAFNYMSEYIMKEEPQNTANFPGRRWGRSKNLPISPIVETAIPLSSYERIRDFCIELIKKRKSNSEDYIQHILEGGDWFIWLDQDVITDILRKAGQIAGANQYKRFLKTGSTDPPKEEIEEIAALYGYDF